MAKKLIYQLYLFGFVGGPQSALYKATKHLARVKEAGADAVWIGPIFKSPWKDHGYDISNYFEIEPRFGTMADFDQFVKTAHSYGLEVLIDLVLGHTSKEHPWFHDPNFRDKFYCWSEEDRSNWENLFDGDSAWAHDEESGKYYLHLFHPDQADLNWFPDGVDHGINQELLWRFQTIAHFWLSSHYVDGFRLDIPQTINKDLRADSLKLNDLIFGARAAEVINEIFRNIDCLLIMECMDPTFGELVDYYWSETKVDYVLNILVKNEIADGEEHFRDVLNQSVQHPGFMLDLESHDSPRFISRGVTVAEMINYLFDSGANAICLYQGQELGLDNPTEEELKNSKMIELDAMTKMQFDMGEDIADLRPISRANARVPLPLEEYDRQEKCNYSPFIQYKEKMWKWKGLV